MLKIESLLYRLLSAATEDHGEGDHGTTDSHGDEGDHSGGHGEFGVHVTYDDIYNSILFFTAIYVAGAFASRILKMPNLVGEIFAGIILGPNLVNFVPNPEAFVMLGEIGLFLLVLEAGIDIDLTMIKLIGARGVLIAIVGSILPIGLGIAIAFAFGTDTKGAIAAGCAFGPTSLGIAMNILRAGKIINTPIGQLIVSAAVIDDMIALIILSQLPALTGGGADVAAIVVPIISALGFLIIGGGIAIFLAPPVLNRYVISKFQEENKGRIELAIMFGLLLCLMPATYYSKASPLMGAFIAGLVFCRSHSLHHNFVSQFKRVMQWLMRIFFATTIGFQVPITHFASGKIILQGLVYSLALFGKLAVGFMVPNFTQSRRFSGFHLRDCLVTGFSMAAEGEFAFVIAVYAVDSGLIAKDLYASIVLAVLISTIIPPFLLRFTISWYDKKAQKTLEDAADIELQRNMSLSKDKELMGEIESHTAVFLSIQTQSNAAWGLLPKIMQALFRMGIDVIDHRSWHPRGVDTTLVNEIYAKDTLKVGDEEANQVLQERLNEIQDILLDAINQPDLARVKVNRWFPGVVTEITEEIGHEDSDQVTKRQTRHELASLISKEASKRLESDKERQTNATRERTVDEILKNVPLPEITQTEALGGSSNQPRRRRRQKMMSSPATSGDMWQEVKNQKASGASKTCGKSGGDFWSDFRNFEAQSGTIAELIVGREVFNVRVTPSALSRVRKGFNESVVMGSSDITPSLKDDATPQNFEHKLMGFVRTPMLTKITEEIVHDDASEIEMGNLGNGSGAAHQDPMPECAL